MAAAPLLARLATTLARRPASLPAMAAAAGGACLAVGALAPAAAFASGIGLALTLTVLAMVDVAALRLPDVLTLPLAAAGLALAAAAGGPELLSRSSGAAVGFLSLWAVAVAFHRLSGRHGLGLGDAKLFAAAGAWTGWAALPSVLLVACALGLGWAAARRLARGPASLAEPIAFGAPLCAATLACWLAAAGRT